MPEFSHQNTLILWHIPSKFSKEMSLKSEVVCSSCWSNLKHILCWYYCRCHWESNCTNENKLSVMCLIMDVHHKYVPTCVAESQKITSHEHSNHCFHKLLFGGDLLTVAGVRGTKELLHTEDKGMDRLMGLCQLLKIGIRGRHSWRFVCVNACT